MIENFKEKYDILCKKYDALLTENEELKSILRQHGITYPVTENETLVFSLVTFLPVSLSLDEKIALFRSFFKGREDVLARRWFSKTTEKGGYQPICTNEWRIGICVKVGLKDEGLVFIKPHTLTSFGLRIL